MIDPLSELAQAAGLILDWEDTQGVPRRVAPDAVKSILTALGHECGSEAACRDSLARLATRAPPGFFAIDLGEETVLPLPAGRARLVLESGDARDLTLDEAPGGARLPALSAPGYHRLEITGRTIELAACPPRCVTPRDLLGRRAWGLTVQIYSLAGAGGFGDFGDLAGFAHAAGQAGADALAISPVHALFADDPGHYSPYSPSSRDHLNGWFADPRLLGGAVEQAGGGELIDWRAAAPAKLEALREQLPAARRDKRFAAFLAEGGAALRRHALFEALHARFRRQGIGDWRAWPEPFRTPQGAEAAAPELAEDIEFHLMLQWLADLGLAGAQQAALAGGMGLGLVTDLAVGLDPAGSHAWSQPEELLSGLTLGAPPDAFQADGQGWGITTFAPEALRRSGFAPFLRTLRAALRHAGGLRIDHALGLKRVWVLPEGASPLEGAYLAYPFEDLLRLIALESQRAQAVVIGEDLGVVPPGLRDALSDRGLLGMRVLPFERDADGAFRRPQAWEARAAAMTSTHDLPPVAGWWRGGDIAWRAQLAEAEPEPAELADRAEGREALWRLAAPAGAPTPAPEDPQPVVDAAIALTAATPCELLLVPVEDLIGQEEQVNLPGIVERHPNWRRRLPAPVSELFEHPAVRRRLALLNRERPR